MPNPNAQIDTDQTSVADAQDDQDYNSMLDSLSSNSTTGNTPSSGNPSINNDVSTGTQVLSSLSSIFGGATKCKGSNPAGGLMGQIKGLLNPTVKVQTTSTVDNSVYVKGGLLIVFLLLAAVVFKKIFS